MHAATLLLIALEGICLGGYIVVVRHSEQEVALMGGMDVTIGKLHHSLALHAPPNNTALSSVLLQRQIHIVTDFSKFSKSKDRSHHQTHTQQQHATP